MIFLFLLFWLCLAWLFFVLLGNNLNVLTWEKDPFEMTGCRGSDSTGGRINLRLRDKPMNWRQKGKNGCRYEFLFVCYNLFLFYLLF